MVKCCVEGCDGPYSKEITYFNFPASKLLRRKWIAAISPPLLKPKLGSMVCSRHFPSEDCESARGRTRLRAGAVPSLFEQTKRQRTDSSSSDSTPIINLKSKPDADADTITADKDHQKDEEDITLNDETPVDNKINKVKAKTKNDLKRKNLHDKLKDLHEKKGSLQNKDIEQMESNADIVTDKTGSKDTKDDSEDKSNDLKDKTDKIDSSDSLNNTDNDNLKDKIDSLQSKDSVTDKDDDLKTKDGEERVHESSGSEIKEESLAVKEKDVQPEKSGDSQDKCKESTPAAPSPKDIDKPEDIEDILTNYHIPTDRRLSKRVDPAPEPTDQQPVFIEISVDKDNSGCEAGKSDCLMVMESVQVELDPSELMLEPEPEVETVEVEDTPLGKHDPISLLTSSDEDDVIIEEPHIDTVEVSDETDEDDMPLVKLLKRRRADKKKEINEDTDFAKILWGMYEYYCVQCHFTTSSGIEYRKHTASHAKVLMMCQICGYMTASEGQFTKHEKQHGEKKYKCHICSYKAKHNMSLLYHLKGHKAEDFLSNASVGVVKAPRTRRKLFSCGRCAYATNKRGDLSRHEARRHKDDEDFVP